MGGDPQREQRRLAVVVNPAAAGGRALDALPAVIEELDRLGAPHRTIHTTSLAHAMESASVAAAAGETVAALGGDGLIRPLAGTLRGRDTALAILPGGRGNDFARVLGIPRDPAEAARVAVEGREQLVDVATVDGQPCVGIASFGFDSDANRIANETRVVKGNLVYLYAALRALAAWRPAHFTVTVDGERHEMDGFSVAVGNSKAFGGGMILLPHAELDDGRLEVLMVSGSKKLAYLRGLAKVFKGTHLDSPHVTLLSGSVVEVDADRPFDIYGDGDAIGRTPATIRVDPRCLRVVVPA